MELPIAILGALGALVAAVATVGAWLAAHQSSRAAAAMTEIERHRWHTQLTPKLGVSEDVPLAVELRWRPER